MVQCIAVLLAVMLFGATPPAFAGDYVNQNLLAKVRFSNLASPALASSKVLPSRVTFGSMTGLAMAPPQSGQNPTPPAKSTSGGLTTKGKVFTWVGIGLIGSGVAEAAYGAAVLKDPCSGRRSCTSNYSTVRGTWLGMCGASVVVGAILLVKGLRSKQ